MMRTNDVEAAVRIEADHRSGSGFFVDHEGHIITAAHVVLNTKEQFMVSADGRQYPARIEKLDDINDVAELKVEEPKVEGAQVGLPNRANQKIFRPDESHNLDWGESVYAIGFPRDSAQASCTKGTFQGYVPALDTVDSAEIAERFRSSNQADRLDLASALRRRLLDVRIHIEPGTSGGPLLNSKGGLVGMSDLGNDHSAYFVPALVLQKFLSNGEDKFDYAYTWRGTPLNQGFLSHPIRAGVDLAVALGFRSWRGTSVPLAAALTVGLYASQQLCSDFQSFGRTTGSESYFKNGLSVCTEIAITLGAGLSFIPQTRILSWVAISAGIAARLGADIIPNHLVLDQVKRNNGDPRPPFDITTLPFK